jgi:hypothetical protein
MAGSRVRSAMRILFAVILAMSGVAHADNDYPLPSETTENRVVLAGLSYLWGSADAYHLAARYEVQQTTEYLTATYAFGAGGGAVGGHGELGVGASALLGMHTFGLTGGVDVMRGAERTIGRVTAGIRLRTIEVGYAYQRPLGGDREDWMAAHLVFVGIWTPLQPPDL